MASAGLVQTKGLGSSLCSLEVAVDGGLKVDDRAEDAAPDALSGEFGEEVFDGVEPGAGGRGEVEDPARVAGEPGFDLGMLVGGVVVEDGVDQLAGRDLALDGVEEADELLVRCRCMQRPRTTPSSMLRAANRVVVPWRL